MASQGTVANNSTFIIIFVGFLREKHTAVNINIIAG